MVYSPSMTYRGSSIIGQEYIQTLGLDFELLPFGEVHQIWMGEIVCSLQIVDLINLGLSYGNRLDTMKDNLPHSPLNCY